MQTYLAAAATALVLVVLLVREFAGVASWRQRSGKAPRWLNVLSAVLVVAFVAAMIWRVSRNA
jgi:hypothetical protein